ncbi:hypothetical protein [Lentzea nigeriaca]|nr:hypothetical protein [Lentzea nigeriaca]MBM7865095.1 hypothetical protein [Lentzea nigeriaca]
MAVIMEFSAREAREVVMRMRWLMFEIQFAAGDAAQSRESAFVRNADFDL